MTVSTRFPYVLAFLTVLAVAFIVISAYAWQMLAFWIAVIVLVTVFWEE